MTNFIIGFVLGVVACTVGFSGMAKIADAGVVKIQETVRENAK